jgi:hypothetical protein
MEHLTNPLVIPQSFDPMVAIGHTTQERFGSDE